MFFVDTNVFVYAQINTPAHVACAELLEAIAEGTADGHTSLAVLEELWHLELAGNKDVPAGTTLDTFELFEPTLPINDRIFEEALDLDAAKLTANDRIHAATALHYQIDTIVSADKAFTGLRGLKRVDPFNHRQMRELRSS